MLKIFSSGWMAELMGKSEVSTVTRTKYQVFSGAASRNTVGVFYTANNIVIVKRYKVTAMFQTNCGGGAAITCSVENGATTLRGVSFETQGAIGGDKMPGIICEIFVATATTITASVIGVNVSHTVACTNMIVEQLPDHEITTQWT